MDKQAGLDKCSSAIAEVANAATAAAAVVEDQISRYTDLYTWAFDRERTLDLFPIAKSYAFSVVNVGIIKGK